MDSSKHGTLGLLPQLSMQYHIVNITNSYIISKFLLVTFGSGYVVL